MPKLRRRLHRMAKKESTEEESEHDAGLDPDIHIKTEIVDIEETMDSSLPDITVERHESVDELRKVLNLPETRIQKMPLAIKSEESFATTSSHLSLGYPNAVQSSSHLLPQYFINTSQPSYQIQITNADNTIIGMPSLPENTGEPGQLNQPNPNGTDVQKKLERMKNNLNNESILETLLQKDVERSDASRKTKKPYVYQKQMTILHTVYHQGETLGNKNIEEIIDTEASEAPTVRRKDPAIAVDPCSHMPNWKLDTFNKEIIQILKANLELHPKELIQDPDEMFFLSQLPYIKKIEPSIKLQFQIEIMKLIQKFVSPNPNSF